MSNKKGRGGEKRRDDQGRLLRTGEYQRANGLYEFRFMDLDKKQRSIYESDLHVLRRREDEIAGMRRDGMDYGAGEVTVTALLERYLRLKRGVRYNTSASYQYILRLVRKHPEFGGRKIREIRMSDAKLWLISLHDEGYAYGTIVNIKSLLKNAFHMAYSEDIIRRNPFDFRMDVIPNDTQSRIALTPWQQKQLMDFVKNDSCYQKYYDELNVLLGTGMRVSELCGLTIGDLDFENRRIRVDHQLSRTSKGKRYIEKTKTEAGRRYIPMSDPVYISLMNILKNRGRVRREPMIDGYTGFLLLDRNKNPKVGLNIEQTVTRICEKYNRTHVVPLPKVTPHVFRHTFCTNMANAGMDLKSLQYLMGHTDVSVTMNVYTHNSYEQAEKAMAKIVPFTQTDLDEQNLCAAK